MQATLYCNLCTPKKEKVFHKPKLESDFLVGDSSFETQWLRKQDFLGHVVLIKIRSPQNATKTRKVCKKIRRLNLGE